MIGSCRRSASIPILAGAYFGSSEYREGGERQPVYIVYPSVSMPIGGFLFFDFIDGGCVVSGLRSKKSFRTRLHPWRRYFIPPRILWWP
jgi:hypothetical protein